MAFFFFNGFETKKDRLKGFDFNDSQYFHFSIYVLYFSDKNEFPNFYTKLTIHLQGLVSLVLQAHSIIIFHRTA